MIEVGSRELKARLSYYLRLMEAGETIAIKIRDRVVGFLSHLKPQREESRKVKRRTKDLERRIEQLKKEGFLVKGGGRYHFISNEPVKMTPGPTASEMIRQMRDEEW